VTPVARRCSAFAAAAALGLLLASPVQASPETLKRALGNVLLAPMDLVLSPAVAARSIYKNLKDVDDSFGVRVAYTLPGFVWNTGVQIGCAAVRELAGLIELGPGLALAFFEPDLDPLFAPVERAEALVDIETELLYVKFGVNYTIQPF
jgi:hypothetical protein